MTTAQWITLIASFFTGGAFGAVITALITKYRSRRQPVGYKIEVIEVFKKNPNYPSLQAILMVGKDQRSSGPGYAIDNLSVARITLTNKGNQDIGEFKFGITLEGSYKAVELRMENPDRHHVINSLTEVSFNEPKKELDFALQPFNREETYTFSIHITYSESPGLILLSSPHSTKFVEMGVVKEMAFGYFVQSMKYTIRTLLTKRLL
jgi:hypothetical protein